MSAVTPIAPKLLLTTKELSQLRPALKQCWLNTARFKKQGPPYLKLGGHVFYTLAEVDRWIESCRVTPEGGA